MVVSHFTHGGCDGGRSSKGKSFSFLTPNLYGLWNGF